MQNCLKRLLIATPNELFRSTNSGRTWRRIESGGFDTSQLRFARVDPNNNHRLVAASTTKLWQSYDFGSRWTPMIEVENTRAIDWGGPGFGDLFVLTDKQLLQLQRSRPDSNTAGVAQ